MPERFTPQQRSRNMSRVHGRDTKPELIVRQLLHSMGFRFRLHRKDLPGSPDIVLPKYRTVIFVHGCFWHGHEGCIKAARPSTNTEFWNRKLDGNKERDHRAVTNLAALGWRVLVVWQCQLRDRDSLTEQLAEVLSTPHV